jgi:hypothetical protein
MTLGYQRVSGHDLDDEIIVNEKARAMDVTGRDGFELPWFELELDIFKQGECIRTWTNRSPPILPSLRATVKVRCSASPANEDRLTSDRFGQRTYVQSPPLPQLTCLALPRPRA